LEQAYDQIIKFYSLRFQIDLVSTGTAIVTLGLRVLIDTHWQRGLSYFQIGWRWIRYAFAHSTNYCLFFGLNLARIHFLLELQIFRHLHRLLLCFNYVLRLLKICQSIRAREGKMILLYEDEFDINLLPGVIGCWTLRGHQRKILTPGQNIKRYGFGAVNFSTGQLTYLVGERKNSDGFIALIEEIVADYCPDEKYSGLKIGLVIDNFIIHRSKKTLAILEKYADRIEIVPLPTYSPKLNIIEMLWKYLRRRVTHNHLFTSIEKLVEAVLHFLNSLTDKPELVLSIVGCSE